MTKWCSRVGNAIGMLETTGLAVSIRAADAMLKAADVRIVRHETRDIALVTLIIEGDLASVQTALKTGVEIAKTDGLYLTSALIGSYHQQTIRLIEQDEKSMWVSRLIS